ncbi:MAG: hypothetical protein IPO25_18550 [Saprospiraceae bacterium]|nr:hypothetical protein [Saprospiraceae bacterium]
MTTLTDTAQSYAINSGTLKIAGGTGIGKNLNVGGITTLTNMTTITNTSSADTSALGALRVLGGMGIGLQLNVGCKTNIEDNTQSTNATTGALKVTGGVGIAKQLNVRGMTSILDGTSSSNTLEGALKVAGGMSVGLQLNVGRMTSILSTAASTTPFTGALKVNGGVGVFMNMHVASDMTINKVATLMGGANMNGTLMVTAASNFIAHFKNTTNQNGILFRISNPAPNKFNNFVEFKNSLGGVVGRIEGENLSEYMSNPTYIREISALDSRIYLAELLVAQSAINLAMAVADLAAAYSSATGCAGVGACMMMPMMRKMSIWL